MSSPLVDPTAPSRCKVVGAEVLNNFQSTFIILLKIGTFLNVLLNALRRRRKQRDRTGFKGLRKTGKFLIGVSGGVSEAPLRNIWKEL